MMGLQESTKVRMKAVLGTYDEFKKGVGVHQAFHFLLFIIVMEETTKETRGEAPWGMLNADIFSKLRKKKS